MTGTPRKHKTQQSCDTDLRCILLIRIGGGFQEGSVCVLLTMLTIIYLGVGFVFLQHG